LESAEREWVWCGKVVRLESVMARVSRVVEGGGKMVDSNGEVFFLCCGIREHEARKGFNGGTCNKSPNRST